ncbi:MAG TPA: hypothetical protein VN703_09855 [Candidatus Sulfopaludibacter sp.]|nr:hypothetical protein [Candidatus Sulfopaludibacter sp.]
METNDIDIRDKIMNKMNKEGRKLSWLASETGINYNTIYSILIHKIIALSDENKSKMVSALGEDF